MWLLIVALAVVPLLVAYKLYVWRRNRDLMLASGLPYVSRQEFDSPMGAFVSLAKNFARTYDFKHERMQSISPAALTIALPFPFFAPTPMVSTVDPVVVKHILKDNFDNYVKPDQVMSALSELLGNGVFGVNHGPHSNDGGAHWTMQRKTAAKVFTKHNFNTKMYTSFARHALVAEQVIDRQLGGGKPIDMQTLLFQYTLDSIGEVGFGVELNSLNEQLPFSHAFDRAAELSMQRFLSPGWDSWLGRLVYKGEREMPHLIKTMNDFMYDIINQRRRDKQSGGDDILSLFLEERYELTDVELRDVVFSVLIAGRDTTAATLSFVLLLLVKHPEWQQTLYEEIVEKRKTCQDEVMQADDLASLKQVQAVIMETLRLYPAVPTDSKQACEDDVLPGGFKIPKGTRIAYEPYMMGRTPQLWGDDCLEFKPERWLKMKTLPSAYTFPVFQAGPRVCLGEAMAKFEMQLMLTFLVERYKFTLPPGVDVESITYLPGITLKIKDGLNLIVERRKQ